MLLLAVQWANGVGRPAVRQAVVGWNTQRIGAVVSSGAAAAVLICALGVPTYGALAAAGGSLLGALILNVSAMVMTFWDRPSDSETGAIRS